MLGYVLAQQYNQNNVTSEASPFTSYIEHSVGEQLSSILRFKTRSDGEKADDGEPYGWGHITADGSIANLESIWYVNLLGIVIDLR